MYQYPTIFPCRGGTTTGRYIPSRCRESTVPPPTTTTDIAALLCYTHTPNAIVSPTAVRARVGGPFGSSSHGASRTTNNREPPREGPRLRGRQQSMASRTPFVVSSVAFLRLYTKGLWVVLALLGTTVLYTMNKGLQRPKSLGAFWGWVGVLIIEVRKACTGYL